MTTKKALKEIADRIRTMEINAVPPQTRQEFRDTQISKFFADRRILKERVTAKLENARQQAMEPYIRTIKHSADYLSKLTYCAQKYAAQPSRIIERLKPHDIADLDELEAAAASARKRGLHDVADSLHQELETRAQAWRGDPFIQGIDREKSRYEILYGDQDRSSLFLGEDVYNPKKEDYGEMRSDGRIAFKDETGSLVVV